MALVVAGLAAAYAAKQAKEAKRQADAAVDAVKRADESNDIAREALAEAAAVRELARREWHRGAQPTVTVRLGRKRAKPRGYELLVETDQDLDSCSLEFAAGTPLTEATGLSAGLAETIFNYNPQVVLGRVTAGTTARPALWLSPSADGVTVRLRCTVTIGENTWGPTVSEVKIPAKARIISSADKRIGREQGF
ncbi:hypothetical protein ACFV9C_42270 [Kribbella sp. NPDC059898]|uniref:hypothetical protein n=1 Tax=Kribbella sp. NPDC059898 TaxID=3346995 RepID=UPI00365CC974